MTTIQHPLPGASSDSTSALKENNLHPSMPAHSTMEKQNKDEFTCPSVSYLLMRKVAIVQTAW
jgi:hypothetical protein